MNLPAVRRGGRYNVIFFLDGHKTVGAAFMTPDEKRG